MIVGSEVEVRVKVEVCIEVLYLSPFAGMYICWFRIVI